MTMKRSACAALVLAGAFYVSAPVLAQDAISHPAHKPLGSSKAEVIPSLAVLNSRAQALRAAR